MKRFFEHLEYIVCHLTNRYIENTEEINIVVAISEESFDGINQNRSLA